MAQKKNTYKKNAYKGSSKKSSGKSVKTNIKIPGILIFFKNEKTRNIIGLFLIVVSMWLFVAFISYFSTWKADFDKIFTASLGDILRKNIEVDNVTGRYGAALSHLFIRKWFGLSSFILLFLFFIRGIKWLFNIELFPSKKANRYGIFLTIWISVFSSYLFRSEVLQILGGEFGYQSNLWLKGIIGGIGTGILLFFSMMSFLIIAFNLKFDWKSQEKEDTGDHKQNTPTEEKQEDTEYPSQPEKDETNAESDKDFEVIEPDSEQQEENTEEHTIEFTYEKAPTNNVNQNTDTEEGENNKHFDINTLYDPTLELKGYQYPPLDLLDDYSTDDAGVRKDELEANKNRIVETLNNYSINIDKIKATIGPTVTLYEIVPAAGVRISKIKNLEDDIALSLAAMGIRIIAPIPGKGTIGIEVPNQNPEIVSIKSILGSDKFQHTKFQLPFGMGKTISNESFIADLSKMPHILMAGATGQGKSVGLNAIIASLLFKKHPAQLKFILIDPKKVELSLFSKIERHFLARMPDAEEAIITDTRKVVRTLNSLNIEMDQRYDLLKSAQVRNIKEYNTKFIQRKLNPNEGHRFLPYLVLVIDEFADLIMTAGKEIETPLTRLAQLARAIGIHLIIATQRPSVNIITGTIKANFPARVAFRVISKIDSRTILDTSGADQLIGRGDMLLATGSDVIRLQCAFLDTHEVEKVCDFIGSQRAYPEAHLLPEYLDEESESSKEFDPNEKDELFEEAAKLIVQAQHGSTSLLQRKLKLGYNRAGRIIDQLEAAGIVGPFEGSKAREVKIKDEMALEQFLKDYMKNFNK